MTCDSTCLLSSPMNCDRNVLAREGLSFYEPPKSHPLADFADSMTVALDSPSGLAPLCEMVGSRQRVAVLFDDATRPTPVSAMLSVLIPYLLKSGVRKENICLVHSPGLHINEENQLKARLGSAFADWPWVVDHDARQSLMVFKGITSFGTPVWVNSVVNEVDFIVGLGSIRPHMDAGFSGGCKILMPGIASKISVDHNHGLMLSPNSEMGSIEGNPVRKDIEEAGVLAGLNFVVNSVVDQAGRPLSVCAGDPVKAHREGVRRFLEIRSTRMPQRMDAVIACTPSVYMNDCLKALIRADMALVPNGALVLCAPEAMEWARPGAVRRFATFPESYMGLSAEQLAKMVVTHAANETRHATAAFNFRSVCEKHDVIVVANTAYAERLPALGRKADSIEQALGMISSGSSAAVLCDAENVYPVID